ncbi:SusC/RagA family TonB-linked outer membrane protein [Leeuwenhoekiella parthenopeia]|uniref:TonB-dependent receptor n=1 Tax=Leeuwenhoekiella parthenopeia TaxID=2890320 RepID=A0ABS8GSI3_9FLAO|nr:TonB-dependent receptor [Leeuwenhoekiella parthenopeia]MCC4211523.1 TonB-dependent receptor [Leeuwenhoekiella parthenopeia]
MKLKQLKKISRHALLLCFAFTLTGMYAQSQITGVVSTSDGQVLPGVNVVEKGTNNGVVTDFDGKYQITTQSANAVLVFSFVGFETLELPVNGQQLVNATMTADEQSLQEVVVVGYGAQKRTDITGSVSSVEGEDLEKAVYNTVDQLLQGRSAGVQVTSSSGEPGANSSVRIRGNNSLSADNSPLYVVDGIPLSGTPQLNPQDIESLEVLKDASATAIYGSRGANGVILVTTKRGQVGKATVSVYQNITLSETRKTYEVLQGQQYAEFRNEAIADLRPNDAPPFPNPEQYAGTGFNWQDEILRTGIRSEYGVNVNGGEERTRYFVSANLLEDKGIVVGSNYRRGTFRTNLDTKLFNDKMGIKVRLNGSHVQNNRAITSSRAFPAGAGPIFYSYTAEPIVPSRDYAGITGEGQQFFNPYLEATAKDDRNYVTDLFASTELSYKITPELTYTFNGGLNFTFNNRDIYTPSNVGAGIDLNGLAQLSQNRSYDYITSNYLTYKNLFAENHDITATAGVEYSEFNNIASNSRVNNFPIEALGVNDVGSATGDPTIGSGRNRSVIQSGFFRLNYAFDSRYLLTATIRADGSSRFAQNEKWGYFPSAALGWRVSEEAFLKDSKTISNLKFRASIGETGTQSLPPYQSLARYGSSFYGTGQTLNLALFPVSVENPNLKWETTRQTDIGIDLGLFQNRVNITADYFKKETFDLLAVVPLPDQVGYPSYQGNFGSIENKGFEFAIDFTPVQNENFSWSSNFNVTFIKNTVLELFNDIDRFGPGLGQNVFGNGHLYRPGEEFGLFYGLKAVGLIQESDFDADGNPLFAPRNGVTQLGSWKFEDVGGGEDGAPDGIITNEDRQVIGNPNPDYTFGWVNDFYYKNFNLNIFIQGSVGNDIYNTIGTVLGSGFQNNESYKNQTVDWYLNRWTPDNPTNDIRYPSINSESPPVANYMVEDGSYIRLQSVSLRYNIPMENSNTFSGIEVYGTATNLFTITDYSGIDPEVSSLGGNTLAPGVDLGVYPRQRGYTMGVNFRF